MQLKYFLFGLMLTACSLSAQTKVLNFAGSQITVPENYKVSSDTQASNENNSVQWINVQKILYDNNVHKQMMKQIETDMHARFLTAVNFKSQGVDFIGKLYKLNAKEGIKYRIISSGQINGQALILNLGFTKQPKQNNDLDVFMRHFISFEN